MPKSPAPKYGCVRGYARVSSPEQALGTSLQDQQNVLQAYARSRGLKGVAVWYVEAESAVHEKFERREKMQQLMASLRAGDLVLCDKLDRWSRDPEFTYRSMRQIREAGATVYFVGDMFDPTTPEGDSMLNMRVMMAREEHKRIRLRMVGTRLLLRNQGYYVEGLAPIGYRRPIAAGTRTRSVERNVLELDEPRAKLVLEFFQLSARGWSCGDILVEARKDASRKWDKTTVNRILRNRIYLGEIKNSTGVWIKGRHPAIIRPELFARTQAALDRRKLGGAKAGTDSRTQHWLLRGLASCGRCGSRMSPAYGGGFGADKNYVDYYRCFRNCGARYVPVHEADGAVGETMFERLVHLRKEIALAPKAGGIVRPTIDFARERAALEKKRDRLLEVRVDGHLSREEFSARMAKFDAARTKIDAAEAQALKRSPLEDVSVRRALLANVVQLQGAWQNLPMEQRRRLVVLLARVVKIERDKRPEIEWRTLDELAEEISPETGLI